MTTAIVSVVICVQLFRNHESRSGGLTDAHMSVSDEILAPLMAEEDVAVWRRKRRTKVRTDGRRVLVAARAAKWVSWWDHSMELSRTL